MNKLLSALMTMTIAIESHSFAQGKPDDTVVIRVGDASKVIVSIHDRKDLETLRHYDFQSLMNDLITKLENKDTVQLTKPSSSYLKDTPNEVSVSPAQTQSFPDTVKENWHRKKGRHWNKRTYNSFNVDFGTNNYLANGKFPDQSNEPYTVRPWGSWYVALNSIQRTHVGGKFFLEWGMGVSWYNFKFQNAQTMISKTDQSVEFNVDNRNFDFIKSKLTAAYLNASLVPVIDFGGGGRKTAIFDGSRVDFSSRGNHSSSFRIGLGPYVGYRIGSYTKQTYEDNGKFRREHNSDNFYLNNIRYGLRFQFGFSDVDFFVNYDLNNLFVDNKGPKLNAFSFGVTF